MLDGFRSRAVRPRAGQRSSTSARARASPLPTSPIPSDRRARSSPSNARPISYRCFAAATCRMSRSAPPTSSTRILARVLPTALDPLGAGVPHRPGTGGRAHRPHASRRRRAVPRICRLSGVAADAATPTSTVTGELVIKSWRDSGGEPDAALELPRQFAAAGWNWSAFARWSRSFTAEDPMWQWPASFVATNASRLHELGYCSAEEGRASRPCSTRSSRERG